MKGLIPKAQLFLKRNGSTILTVFGAIGVAATAVSAVKATPKATRILEKAKEEKGEKLTKLETISIAGPTYIPSILIGASTIACIFGANALNKRQQASLASLYSFIDSCYKEYRNNVQDTLGQDAEKQIIQSIAKDHYDENKIQNKNVSKQVFMDFNSLQIFESTLDEIKRVEKLINDLLVDRGYVYLSEYHEALGINSIESDYETGWSLSLLKLYECDRIEFIYDKTIMPDGSECYLIITSVDPTYNCIY